MGLCRLPPVGEREGGHPVGAVAGVENDHLGVWVSVEADNDYLVVVVAGERGPRKRMIPAETGFTGGWVVRHPYIRWERQIAPGDIDPAVVEPEMGVFTRHRFPAGFAKHLVESLLIAGITASDGIFQW